MAEELFYPQGLSKKETYEAVIPQIKALVSNEQDLIANMANLSAVLKQIFNFFWVGFYRVKGDSLILGPFQGPIACTRIRYGRGVCGTAWKEKKAIIVPDVDKFPGHIACSSQSRSEIVIPVFDDHGNVFAVLDIDSDKQDSFDETDRQYLKEILSLLVIS